MPRPSEDQVNLTIARVASARTTCLRRAVGCVLVDARGHILSTGRNGVARGRSHCNEGYPCPGHDAPSGTNLSGCDAIHAEINAIAHCQNPAAVDTIYLTDAPCRDCVKALLALPNARRIVAAAPYAKHAESETWWTDAGREWEIQPLDMIAPGFGVARPHDGPAVAANDLFRCIAGYTATRAIDELTKKFTIRHKVPRT